MIEEFPTYTSAARKGEKGVNIVSQIVSDNFGWIFKRNPQEYDFGIDGHIELVNPDGSVTGKVIAVQIKCGKSFFRKKNRYGYTYYGEKKHYNYLCNYPMPVIIIICSSFKELNLWAEFSSSSVRATEQNWKITIPNSHVLNEAKNKLIDLAGSVENH